MQITKPALSSTPLLEAIALRWSGRAFDPRKPVAEEDLRALLEAARWSPSSMNAQPWRFVTMDRQHPSSAWQVALETLAPSNQIWAREAPLLLAVLAETRFPNGDTNRWAEFDTGAALMALSIEASHRGLMIHPMGGFDSLKLRTGLKLPESWTPLCIAAIGHQLPRTEIPESLLDRELSERIRNPLESIWFDPDRLNF